MRTILKATILTSATALAAMAALTLPSAALGVTPPARYAGPNGSGADCTTAAPCGIVTAITNAPANSEVIIEPGNYGTAANPVTAVMTDTNGPLNIHGESGQPRPVITAAGANNISLTDASHLSDIELDSSASVNVLFLDDTASADHVIVRASGTSDVACANFGTLTDSLCTASGANGAAVKSNSSGNATRTMIGDTAEATGAVGVGLLAPINNPGTNTVDVTNSIIHGNGLDINASATAGGTVNITLSHSDVGTSDSTLGAGTVAIHSDSTDITTPPTFTDATSGDYTEAAGSATIDKGASVAAADTTDLAGKPRTQGSAPDIGAYEFTPPKVITPAPKKPTAHGLKVHTKTAHTAHLTVKVNPEGLTTKVKLVATHGKHKVTSKSVSAGHGTKTKTVKLTLKHLKKHTKYKVHAVATSSAGHATSHTKTAKTKK